MKGEVMWHRERTTSFFFVCEAVIQDIDCH